MRLFRILLWLLFGRYDRVALGAMHFHDADLPHDPRDDGRHCPICGRPADVDAEVCWACGEVVVPTMAGIR